MAYGYSQELDFEGLELKGVIQLNRRIGSGAFGIVYAVKIGETICAAKQVHSILIEGVSEVERQYIVESFMRECQFCSTLRHPNIVQFLGIYYPEGTNRTQLPAMVMEMMASSLNSFIEKHTAIPVDIKYSIIHDVSLGLNFLHNHDPPIVHRDLSSNNILLTTQCVAKISDLGVAKVVKSDNKTMTTAPGTVDFMPPEALSYNPVYGPPMDVFSFGVIILHVFTQKWPTPSDKVEFNPKTRKQVAFSEIRRRQHHLNEMAGEARMLLLLLQKCLDDDPNVRPTIANVTEKIQTCMRENSPRDVITLYKEVEQLRIENEKRQTMLESEQQNPTEQVCIKNFTHSYMLHMDIKFECFFLKVQGYI